MIFFCLTKSVFLCFHIQNIFFCKISLFQNKGIKIYPKTNIKNVSKDSKLDIELDDGRILSSDELLVATGRKANTDNLKLENIGVEISHDRSIVVN